MIKKRDYELKIIRLLSGVLFAIGLIVLSTVVYLYDKQHQNKIGTIVYFFDEHVRSWLIQNLSKESGRKLEKEQHEKERHENVAEDVARNLLNGGYILHFRHAERDKWINVEMYDALESDVHDNGENSTRYAEDDYFKDAVCLNERGEIQARAIGEHLKQIGLPIGYVISSPSCRSRQTAELAFGGYDRLDRDLVHRGPYNETETNHISSLKDLYLNLPLNNETNTIVSAHNKVAHEDMFDKKVGSNRIDLQEGGFLVISRRDNKLILVHRFYDFLAFQRIFYER